MTFNNNMLMAGATANASGYSITNSARFVSGNSAYLERTPGVAGNKQIFTISTWFKLGILPSSAERRVLFSANSANPYFRIELDDSTVTGALMVYQYNGAGYDFQLMTTQVFRDPAAWYHVVVAFDTTQGTAANRIKVYVNGSQITAFGTADYPSASLNTYWNATNAMRIGRGFGTDRFDGYLANTTAVDGSQLTPSSFGQTNTSGVWVPKAYSGTYGTNGFFLDYGNSSYLGYDVKTSGVTTKFTNSSEWTGDTGDFSSLAQNIVPTGGNTGGIRTNDTFTGDFAVQFQWQGGANPAYLSVYDTVENATFNSATADAGVNSMTNAFQMFFGAGNVVDAKRGVTGTVSAGIFTVSANDWIKLQRSGSTFTCYQNGTLRYTWVATSSATMRIVVSQNSSSMDWRSFTWTAGSTTPANSFYVSGLVAGDQMTDTPTLNYCTLNPLIKNNTTGSIVLTYSNGNLRAVGSAANGTLFLFGTMPFSSGKHRMEATVTNLVETVACGIVPVSKVNTDPDADHLANGIVQYFAYTLDGKVYNNNSNVQTNTASSLVDGELIAVEADITNGQLEWFHKDSGVWVSRGTYTFTPSGDYVFGIQINDNGCDVSANFGQQGFDGTPTSGFGALNSSNLPAPAIKDGSAHYQASLYTGNGTAIGSGGKAVTQTGNSTFTPDLVWIKARSSAENHNLADVVRGVTKIIRSNTTAAEDTQTESIATFDSSGFTVGNYSNVNTNAVTHVGWQWKAGGAGVSNTSGTITSTVSANPTAGISIVTYTGTGANATVGHGLGVAPKMIIVKERSPGGDDWYVYHASLTSADYYVMLNRTTAQASGSMWNNTAPTSSVFSLTSYIGANASGSTYVAYCFAPIAGFSAFGSYTGNGSADGPFIYTGFKPAWVLIKRSNAVENWTIHDTARDTYNECDKDLLPDSTATEDTGMSATFGDITSNGFKCRSTSTATNGSGDTYVYAAFASNPFGGSGAAPATAR